MSPTGVVLVVILALFMLSACGTERYLTVEQDREIAKVCAHGCAVIPLPVEKRPGVGL